MLSEGHWQSSLVVRPVVRPNHRPIQRVRNQRQATRSKGKSLVRAQIRSQNKVQESEANAKVRPSQETELKSGYTRSQSQNQETEPSQGMARFRTERMNQDGATRSKGNIQKKPKSRDRAKQGQGIMITESERLSSTNLQKNCWRA